MLTVVSLPADGEAAAVRSLSGVGGRAASLSAPRCQAGETGPHPGSDGAAEEVAGRSQQGQDRKNKTADDARWLILLFVADPHRHQMIKNDSDKIFSDFSLKIDKFFLVNI